jgi:DNA-binding protein HU-beta
MAKKGNTDFVSYLRSSGLRKRVAKTLAELEADPKGNAEKLGRRVITDLRSAADAIEKRLDIGGAGTRSAAAKKAASTRKRATAKRSASAKKGASTRARKTTARKTTARKTTARKTTARKTTARKRTPRKSS